MMPSNDGRDTDRGTDAPPQLGASVSEPPQLAAPPPWLGWIAWGVGALALFYVLVGEVALDALDAEYPSRDVVRMAARTGPPLPLQIAPEAEDNAEVRDALSLLPELLALLIEQKGARVTLTNLAAIRERGVHPNQPISHVAGYFSPADWELRIAHDAERPGMVALHEYGHFVDAALGGCSGTPAFDSVYQAAVSRGQLGVHYASSAAETFAYMFSQHFFSDRRRVRLEADYPEGSAFVDALSTTGQCPAIETP